MSYTELQTALLLLTDDADANEKIDMLFHAFDKDKSGKISKIEFQRALQSLFRSAAALHGDGLREVIQGQIQQVAVDEILAMGDSRQATIAAADAIARGTDKERGCALSLIHI